mgnify:CR=1 FL=1
MASGHPDVGRGAHGQGLIDHREPDRAQRAPLDGAREQHLGVPVVGTDGMLINQYQTPSGGAQPWVWPVASATVSSARIMAREGDGEGALALAVKAVEIASRGDDVITPGYCRMGCAEVLLLQGNATDALRWIQETHDLYARKGIVPWTQKAAAVLASFAGSA